jgi:predicted metal-dependent peptidase
MTPVRAPQRAVSDLDTLLAREAERVSALRADFIVRHAFWATLILPMRIQPSVTLPTFGATNGIDRIWYNPYWTRVLTPRQFGYVLLHEVGHVAFLHALREGPRDHDRWNLATDAAVNLMLDEIQVPAHAWQKSSPLRPLYDRPTNVAVPGLGVFDLVHLPWAKGLTAEEVYDLLSTCEPDLAAKPSPTSGGGGGGENQMGAGGKGGTCPSGGSHPSRGGTDVGQGGAVDGPDTPDWSCGRCSPGQTCLQTPGPVSADARECLADRVVAAYEAWTASEQRGTLSAGITRLVAQLRRAKVPWQRVLQRYASTVLAKDDYSLSPPNRRWLVQADLILPSLRSERPGQVVVLIDASGSISKPTLEAFGAEIAKLHTYAEDTLILTHDVEVHQVIPTREIPAFLRTLEITGGGGTSHVPAFTYLREHRVSPELVIALTDLYSDFPERKPAFPVLWCVPEDHHGEKPHWGQLVEIPDGDT